MMKNTLTKIEFDNMKIPVKGLSFAEVIEGLSGFKVLPLDEKADKELLNKIHAAAQTVIADLIKTPMIKNNSVQVGNQIEKNLKEALINLDLKLEKFKKKSSGYPDMLIYHEEKRTYLECKTHSKKTKDSTQRTFYLSPSNDFKVNFNARHLLIAFEMEANGTSYTATSYKLLSLENLLLDVKYEFNASNRGLYKETKLLKTRSF